MGDPKVSVSFSTFQPLAAASAWSTMLYLDPVSTVIFRESAFSPWETSAILVARILDSESEKLSSWMIFTVSLFFLLGFGVLPAFPRDLLLDLLRLAEVF